MSSIKVQINDETAAGKVLTESRLEFSTSLVSVAEIIEKRVLREVEQYNQKRTENFTGLVQPIGAEVTGQGFRMHPSHFIDPQQQAEVAKKAFERNGFFMLIDNIQAESLEQTFLLHNDSVISFVKLTPLVGG